MTSLSEAIAALADTSSDGFEGLVRDLMEQWTGLTFRLARTGSQHGRDMRSVAGAVIMAEAKHYKDSSNLSKRDLGGELVEAIQAHPDLDLWVLATSKEVTDSESGILEREAVKQGIEVLTLDSRVNGIGPFQVFCVEYGDVTIDFLKRASGTTADEKRLQADIDAIKAAPNYDDAVMRLRNTLSSSLFGFQDAVRRMRDWLDETLGHPDICKSRLGQDAAILDDNRPAPIVRETIEDALTPWWGAGPEAPLFSLLGEEGTGKTWAALAWARRMLHAQQDDPPLVIPITSNQSFAEDIWEVLAHALDRILGTQIVKPLAWWERRIDLWLQAPPTSRNRRILVILDGLNERPRIPWRTILTEVSSAERFRETVALLATCRPQFWEKLGIETAEKIETKGYTDAELQQAVAGRINLDEVPDDLRPLLRKPRYCDLTIQHSNELETVGEFTVERLLYHDYKYRHAKKIGHPLDDGGFRQILGALAQRYKDTLQKAFYADADLRQLLPNVTDESAALQDIIDGGLMVPSGRDSRPYKVDERRLVHGLGMLLWEDLSELEEKGAEDDFANELRAWIEPKPNMDLKVGILGAAVFFSIIADSTPSPARRALLSEWVGSQNMTHDQEQAIVAYFPHCPSDILDITDSFWNEHSNNADAQDRLARALVNWRDDGRARSHIVFAVERWMSYIHKHGEPFARQRFQNAKKEEPVPISPSDEIARHFSAPLHNGQEALFEERHYPITEDDGKLHLSRLGIIVAAAGDRAPFAEAFVRWAVSRRIMDDIAESEEALWALRLCDIDPWPTFRPLLADLVQSENEILQKAAHRVLTAFSGHEALTLKRDLPDDLFPTPDRILEHRKNPCQGHFTWTKAECTRCLGESDLNMRTMLSQANHFVCDPTFEVPDTFIERLKEDARNAPVASYSPPDGSNVETHYIQITMPALARFAPGALGKLIRRIIAEAASRSDEDAKSLIQDLPHLAFVAGEKERSSLEARHRKLRIVPNLCQSRDNGGHIKGAELVELSIAEAFAFHKSPEAFVEFLLQRPQDTGDPTWFGDWIEGLADDMLRSLTSSVLELSAPHYLTRLLWILSHQSAIPVTETLRDRIEELCTHDDMLLAAMAVRFAVATNDEELALRVIERLRGAFTDNRDERHFWFATLVINHAIDRPFEDLGQWLSLDYLGHAIVRRGTAATETKRWAAALDHLLSKTMEKNLTFREREIRAHLGQSTDMRHPVYESTDNEYSISTKSALKTWTPPYRRPDNYADFNDEDIEAARWDSYLKALDWVHKGPLNELERDIHSIYILKAVCQTEPKLVDTWISWLRGDSTNALKGTLHAGAFYQMLCTALADVNPTLGFELWDLIGCNNGSMEFVDTKAYTNRMMSLPFSAPTSPEALAARDTQLSEIAHDADLGELAAAASAYDRHDWIADIVQRAANGSIVWHQARAVTLAALADLTTEEFKRHVARFDFVESWVNDRLESIRAYHQNNLWAKHWYRRFLTDNDRDSAYGAFTLFLKCVDRRFASWAETEEEALVPRSEEIDRRVRYRWSISNVIKKSIKENEKQRQDVLFGQKFRKSELLPARIIG